MDLVTPGVGLIFWTALTFVVVLVILRRFAWKPILGALDEREKTIADSLAAAEKAKEEMAALNAQNQKLLQEAIAEREKILREAKAVADRFVNEAKEKAIEESNRIIASAQEAIRNEKQAAMTEVRNQVANLSLTIAEKLLKNELSNKNAQIELAKSFMNEIKAN
ncbi:F0F1 ATP synthase subunit B [Thermoflexibacter ruber]|uniref:ATP synthase subunit b n=1 Tax=Thermoflexibacter ruber TaxID=1003 RepID=A0A1I2EWU4_9BACT|nr:F0F1 ATP synthase subunit B [Thermoflexibacter ruber]SFE96936.1 ATP synthase F0 subcomplex B subunit [Thermoflexibacter ruber]